MKVVFFGTSAVGLPTLEQLYERTELVAVVTSPDAKVGRKQTMTPSPIAQTAAGWNIPIFKPEKVKGNAGFLKQLQELSADAFVVVSYGKILPKEIIDLPPLKTINVHFSALPKYRGATPMQFALLNGDPTTTITVFILDELLDHGPVLTQTPVAIDPCDTFATLADRLAVLSGPLVISTLTDYASGNITPKEQDHSEATYTKILTKEDGRVDWSRTAAEIHNQFRAFYPWPGLWTTWEGKTVKIKDCSVAPNLSSSLEPGTVLDGGIIACGHKTALQILQLQLEGKTTVDIKEFLNGYKNFNGSKLI